ncbi:MAG TPA: AI-2E family transporter, partial [Vineibacter sp.]|nr:AI-2E family transporter [Vineibacter sp.]
INDAVVRLSRYLATQFLINIGFGVVVAVGLWIIGMPNPLVWGLLGGVLRFIPFAGAAIGALAPTLLAVAVAPGWTLPLLTLGLVVVCEVIAGQVVEPLLYGSSTGMSPLAVLISTITWAALWGPVGLLLAMPLTVCLVVMGRHVPQLAFLGILLADEPTLPAEAQVYHRLLARSPLDAVEIAVDYARENGAPALFDSVLLPVLMLAEVDRRRAALDGERQQQVVEGIEEIIAAVEDDAEPRDEADDDKPATPPASMAGVLCVGGRSDLDHAAAMVAAASLRRREIPAQAQALRDLAPHTASADAVAFCVVLPGSATVINHLLRRFRARGGPAVPIVIGAFAPESGALNGQVLPSYPIARTCDALGDLIAAAGERQRQSDRRSAQ